MRRMIVVVVMTGALSACSPVGGTDPSVPATTDAVPSLTATDEADLAARALLEVCTRRCADKVVYVHDSSFTINTLAGDETPLPEETMAAIEAQLRAVVFVDAGEADALFGTDGLTDGGRRILMSVGPVTSLAADVVGVEVGAVTARDGGAGGTEQFRWSGRTWEPAEPDETGIPTPTWVS
jgi:hypothetical protein